MSQLSVPSDSNMLQFPHRRVLSLQGEAPLKQPCSPAAGREKGCPEEGPERALELEAQSSVCVCSGVRQPPPLLSSPFSSPVASVTLDP